MYSLAAGMLIDVLFVLFSLFPLFYVHLLPAPVMQLCSPLSLQMNFCAFRAVCFCLLEVSHSQKKFDHDSVLLVSPNLVVLCFRHRIGTCVFVGKRIKGGLDAQRKKFLFIRQVLIVFRVVTLFFFVVHVWWYLKCDFRSSMFTAVLGRPQRGVICSTVILYHIHTLCNSSPGPFTSGLLLIYYISLFSYWVRFAIASLMRMTLFQQNWSSANHERCVLMPTSCYWCSVECSNFDPINSKVWVNLIRL